MSSDILYKNPCKLCNNEGIINMIARINENTLYKCKNCGFVFKICHNDINSEISYDIYEKNDEWIENRAKNNASRTYAKRIYEIYGRYLTGKTLLEIGPGDGWNLRLARENGFQVYGVETSKKNCEYIKKTHDIDCINNKIENINFDKRKFDNILLSHVIEHIEYPSHFINQLRNLLGPNGVIILITPNLCSLWAILYTFKWSSFYVPDHISFFCHSQIKMLLGDMNILYSGSYEAEHQYFDMFAGFLSRGITTRKKDIKYNIGINIQNDPDYVNYLKPVIYLLGKPFRALSKSKRGTDLIFIAANSKTETQGTKKHAKK